MNIKLDNLDRIALDRFQSTSGKYELVLACRMEQGWHAYYIVVLVGGRIRKIVGAGIAEFGASRIRQEWERLKESLTAPAQEEEPTFLEEAELNTLCLEEFYYADELIGYISANVSQVNHTSDSQGDPAMKTEVIGSRILVKPIIPVDEVSARLKAVGIEPVIAEVNKPRPTMGVIVALGDDPMVQERFRLGDVVIYGKHSGDGILEDGQEYRALGLHEIIGRRRVNSLDMTDDSEDCA